MTKKTSKIICLCSGEPELAQGPCDECDIQPMSQRLWVSESQSAAADHCFPKTCDKPVRLLITEEDVWKQEVGEYVS